MMEKFCPARSTTATPSELGDALTHQACLNQLGVNIVVLWRVLHLEDNLDQGAGEVLDEDDLGEGGLQDGLEVTLPCSYIARRLVRNPSDMRSRAGALTSNPCCWPYDDIDVCLIWVLVSALGLDGAVDGSDDCVPGV